ncbi:unnamed protein product [Euphydryas editha]|uniref:Uncharacterized protein n=1 Tax=Euphydryas editha TaxID=104508 RepID=A0AAU9UXQ5_EUPED|nr:unnamed protein product [Euphydryas editha]
MKKYIQAKFTSTETNTNNNNTITRILEKPPLSPAPSDNSITNCTGNIKQENIDYTTNESNNIPKNCTSNIKQDNIDYTTNESNNIPKKHKNCICHSNNTLDNSNGYQSKCHTPLDECYGQYDIVSSQSEGHFDTSNEYYDNSYVDNSQNICQDTYNYMYNNAISQAGSSKNVYVDNTMYQSLCSSSNINEMYYNTCVLPPLPPPPPLDEPELDISNNSSLSSTLSLNNGLNSIRNIPSTSKDTNELPDIINFLSNSSNQDLIENLQLTIAQSQPGDYEPDNLVKKCNNCDYKQYRIEYYKEKVEKMRSTNDTLKKKVEMLDESMERLNNALSAFEKLTISRADPLNVAVATQDVLKEKIMEYLIYTCNNGN